VAPRGLLFDFLFVFHVIVAIGISIDCTAQDRNFAPSVAAFYSKKYPWRFGRGRELKEEQIWGYRRTGGTSLSIRIWG
jgi:hypothetical protein